MADPFVGRGDLGQFMDVDLTTLNAALADLALAAAQAAVREYLDQEITFVSGDVAVLDGYGKPWVRLPERPVRAVSLVEEGNGQTADFVTVPAADWVLRRSILYRVDGSHWSAGNVNIRVTYDHGYDVATAGTVDSESDSDFEGLHVPADIVLVTLSAARRIYDGMGANPAATDIIQESIGSYSYSRERGVAQAAGVSLIPAEKLVLERYRVDGAG